ncbi:MAG: hypothetical protein M0017_07805 [Desulfobacteraceae bacterium]|nr:hypothetical protein [Desulfobacteraceae bacterium]
MARLPVAPRTMARVRWAAEAKPAPAMPPAEAAAWLEQRGRAGGALAGVEFSGPGDPLATPDLLFEALGMVHGRFPDLLLEVATLGLGGGKYGRRLVDLGVRRVTLLVDAADPEAAARVYAWVRPGTKTIPLADAAALLIDEQAGAVAALKEAGISVHIRTTVCLGMNEDQVEAIARKMAGLGAESMTLLPASPGSDAVPEQVAALAAGHLRLQPPHVFVEPGGSAGPASAGPVGLPAPSAARPNVAVVSLGGMEVDLHLGQAIKALIYGPREDGLVALLAARDLPEPGGGPARWEEAARILHDCFALLAASAGDSPKRVLGDHGIRVLVTEGEIGPAVDLLYGGGKKKR